MRTRLSQVVVEAEFAEPLHEHLHGRLVTTVGDQRGIRRVHDDQVLDPGGPDHVILVG